MLGRDARDETEETRASIASAITTGIANYPDGTWWNDVYRLYGTPERGGSKLHFAGRKVISPFNMLMDHDGSGATEAKYIRNDLLRHARIKGFQFDVSETIGGDTHYEIKLTSGFGNTDKFGAPNGLPSLVDGWAYNPIENNYFRWVGGFATRDDNMHSRWKSAIYDSTKLSFAGERTTKVSSWIKL